MFLMNIPGKWRRPLFLDLTCETFFSSTEVMTLFMRYLKRQSLSHFFCWQCRWEPFEHKGENTWSTTGRELGLKVHKGEKSQDWIQCSFSSPLFELPDDFRPEYCLFTWAEKLVNENIFFDHNSGNEKWVVLIAHHKLQIFSYFSKNSNYHWSDTFKKL